MVSRREFIGSAAIFGFASGATAVSGIWQNSLCAATLTPVSPADLGWNSQVIQTVPHHTALRPPVVTGVSQQNGGDLIAIAGDDHIVCLFDARQQGYTNHLRQHTDWVRSVSFSPDGGRLATVGNDRTLVIWNARDLTQTPMIKRQPEAIIDLAFSPNGKQIATVGFDEYLRVYDVDSGEQTYSVSCPSSDNHAVGYSIDGKSVAAGGRCGTIRVWSTSDFTESAEFKLHRNRIRSIEFMTDGRIVSAGDDQFVRITNPTQPDAARSLPRMRAKLYATTLMDNGLIATAGSDNKIHIWQISDLQTLGFLTGHTGTVTSLAYRNGQLVSGSFDTTVRVWNTKVPAAIKQRQTELNGGWNPTLK